MEPRITLTTKMLWFIVMMDGLWWLATKDDDEDYETEYIDYRTMKREKNVSYEWDE